MRFLFLIVLAFSTSALAQNNGPDPFRSTAYPLPRFVSLASNEAFVRTGPGKKYPIQWVFKRKGLPVEIILEFDHWRKVRDVEGQEGWLHKSLLSGRRAGIVKSQSQISLHKDADGQSPLRAYLAPNVVAQVKTCANAWCYVDASGYKGWVEQAMLWGVYPKENIED